ncbi:MAG: twin-arginine translocase TatA/TatE family subunit [Bryobacteraceae bacterium]
MGPLGVQEIIVIFILALVLFGPKKLPELGRMLGKTISEFRKAKDELRNSWESHMSEIERETNISEAERELQDKPSHTDAVAEHEDEYSYSYEDYDRYEAEEPEEVEMEAVAAHPAETAAHAAKSEPASEPHEVSTPHSAPARSNGTSPGASAPVSAKEEHPAA